MFNTLIAYSGALASIWIVLGVIIASRFYPGYSHSRQFCSELGAAGSPTQRLSPAINNYPLGFLFSTFGCYILINSGDSDFSKITGAMFILHGVGTAIAGFFPMVTKLKPIPVLINV